MSNNEDYSDQNIIFNEEFVENLNAALYESPSSILFVSPTSINTNSIKAISLLLNPQAVIWIPYEPIMLPTATFNEPQVISSLIKEASRICCFSNWYLSIKHLLKIILVLSLKTSSVSKVEFLSLNFTKIWYL